MLVTIWGQCTYVETIGDIVLAAWIDDGSNLWDGTRSSTGAPIKGVRLRFPTQPSVPVKPGAYYIATGIMRTDRLTTGECVRCLWVTNLVLSEKPR